jgi:hypothetical protein
MGKHILKGEEERVEALKLKRKALGV